MLDYLLSALNDAVLAFNVNEQSYMFVSPAIESISGYKPDDFIKNHTLWKSLIHPEDVQKFTSVEQDQDMPGEHEISYRILVANKQLKWVQDKRVHFIHDESKHEIKLNIIKDITEIINYKKETDQQVWFLNSLIDAEGSLTFRIDTEGHYTYLNPGYINILGYNREEIIGQPISKIALPEEVSILAAAFNNCIIHPGKIMHLLHGKVAKNKKVHWVNANYVAVTNHDGKVTEIQGTGVDVTETLEAQKKLQEILTRLDFYMDSITDAFFILDKDWKFIRVNSAFENLAEKPREQLIGNVIWEVVPASKGDSFEENFRKAVDGQVTVKFSDYMPESKRWFRVAAYPSEEGLTVIIRDFTTQKNAEEQAMWTKHNLEALINNTEDLIWSIDEHKNYVFVNDAFKKWMSKHYNLLVAEIDEFDEQTDKAGHIIGKWRNYYEKVLKGERFSVVYETVSPVTNETTSFEVSFNPIFNNELRVTGAGCFAHNIARRLMTERSIKEQNERLRNIASLSSHELRRPVATIIGLIDLLDLNDLNNPDNYQVVDHLKSESKELDSVIRLIVNKTFIDDIAANGTGRTTD